MTDSTVIIILTEELEGLERFLEEQYKNRRRMKQALAIWGIIAIVAFIGIIALVDGFVIR